MWLALLTSNCQIGGGSGKLLSIDVGTCGYACEAAYSIRVTGKVFGLKWDILDSGSFHQASHMQSECMPCMVSRLLTWQGFGLLSA